VYLTDLLLWDIQINKDQVQMNDLNIGSSQRKISDPKETGKK
jgi:hypothetical protein